MAARPRPEHENASDLRHDPSRRREERVVNQEDTLAAREKQKLIKERFRSWVFTDPNRTERLVRLYNDTYNNLRPRLFDGSHLDFPGMNQNIKLRPHQDDAVWRGMSSGNTLLAHVVGAGKTFTMAATGMKMKQAGLIKKPMYVVPNHLLEQFSREFMQLYPNAKLLVAAKEDLTRDRRKLLTAKIASGQWDGIIVTHSSFERIGMSRDYQEKFLREQIAEYDELLREHARSAKGANRNLIKTIEKQKAAREERLKTCSPSIRRMTGWCSTNSASIMSSSTRPIISRTWRRRPRWTASPASRPAAPSGLSTCI
jgi:N12 class adenine-specific DNA methylase